MKFFLDTANLDELKKGAAWGIVDGVTTNPTLIAKEGRPIEEQVRMICDIVDGDISAEVVQIEANAMVKAAPERDIGHVRAHEDDDDPRDDTDGGHGPPPGQRSLRRIFQSPGFSAICFVGGRRHQLAHPGLAALQWRAHRQLPARGACCKAVAYNSARCAAEASREVAMRRR